jgi:hypothetical protein
VKGRVNPESFILNQSSSASAPVGGGRSVALAIEQDQRTMLAHRQNFMGRSVSYGTVAWDYHGRTWLVERPEDGEPAVTALSSVRCAGLS